MSPNFEKAKETFAKRYKAAKENSSKPFGGDDIPPGTYIGRVKKYERGVAKTSGRNQTVIEIMIADGDSKGLVARQYQGLDPTSDGRDIGLDITLRTIQFFGYELASTMSSLEELDPYLEQITQEAPAVQFKFTLKGDFANIELQKCISVEADEDAEAPSIAVPDAVPEAEVDKIYTRLVHFALEQGVESVVDGMTSDEIIAEINGQVFWTDDCTEEDLKGTDAEGQNPADGIHKDTATWLLEMGVDESSIIRHKPKASVKATAKKSPLKKGKK